MTSLTFTEAFARYGAKPVNVQWAVSAIAEDGAFVMSCWKHYCTTVSSQLMRYEDKLSRWTANKAGNNLLREHLQQALDGNLPVRALFVRTDDPEAVDRGEAVTVSKHFYVRKDLVGHLASFDGDHFVIEFERAG